MNDIKIKQVQYRLFQCLNSEHSDYSYTLIASYLLRNFKLIKNVTVEKLCEDLYVSISTLRRFCLSIGYDNFTDLKNSIDCIDKIRVYSEFNLNSELKSLIDDFHLQSDDKNNLVKMMCQQKDIYLLFPQHLYSVSYSFQSNGISTNNSIYLIPNIDKIISYVEKPLENNVVIILDVSKDFTNSLYSYIEGIECEKIRIGYETNRHHVFDLSIKIPKQKNEIMEKYYYSLIFDELYLEICKNNRAKDERYDKTELSYNCLNK